MLRLFFNALATLFRSRADLALENLALRQQLAVFKHRKPRPRLADGDRLFWIVLSKLWGGTFAPARFHSSSALIWASSFFLAK